MFQFPRFASISYVFRYGYRRSGGLPHSEIPGSKLAHSSPRLIAACHVLHRLYMPRHPPDALNLLEIAAMHRDQITLINQAGYPRSQLLLTCVASIQGTLNTMHGILSSTQRRRSSIRSTSSSSQRKCLCDPICTSKDLEKILRRSKKPIHNDKEQLHALRHVNPILTSFQLCLYKASLRCGSRFLGNDLR